MSEFVPESEIVRESFNFDPSFTEPKGEAPGFRLPAVPLRGSGGQGWVFYAEGSDGNHYAVKIHKASDDPSSDAAQQAIRAFEKEGELLQEFDHPNIIKVLRTGVHHRKVGSIGEGKSKKEFGKDYRYMVMEFAEQGSLADRISKQYNSLGRLPVEDGVLSILQASEGIRYAHKEAGVTPPNLFDAMTHGDLNPRNLVVTGSGHRQGVVKVADFGIARKARTPEETITGTQIHAFSLHYAAPEQIDRGRVWISSDIYSLGVTAYELLTGVRPIRPEFESPSSYLKAHEEQTVKPMEAMMNGKIDRVIEALNGPVLKAMRRGPDGSVALDSQYASMGDLQEDVRVAWARGQATAARDKTIILLSDERTVPLTAEQLLYGAELLADGGVHLADTDVAAGHPSITLAQETHPVGEVRGSTRFLHNASGSRRRFLRIAGTAALAALGGGSVWLNTHNTPETAEAEKLKQEQTAIADLADKTITPLLNARSGNGVIADILPQFIPYNPARAKDRIEQLISANETEKASWLAAQLVDYDPDKAQAIMWKLMDQGAHDAATTVALRLASFGKSPAGKGHDWTEEVEKIRLAVVANAAPKKLQTYQSLFTLAYNAKTYTSISQLSLDDNDMWAIRSAAIALGPLNQEAVAQEAIKWNSNAEATEASHDPGWLDMYEFAGALCKIITPYAPKRVLEIVASIKNPGVKEQLLEGLIPYNPEAVIQAVKKSEEPNPREWSLSGYQERTIVALSRADPAMVAQIRDASEDEQYKIWLDVALDPGNPSLIGVVYDAMSHDEIQRGVYAVSLVNALLRSRMPKPA